jgi:hypothetical protein
LSQQHKQKSSFSIFQVDPSKNIITLTQNTTHLLSKHKNIMASPPPVFQAYEVTKQHHRMGWLNQRRAIILTLTEVLICKVTSTTSVPQSQLSAMDDEISSTAQTILNAPFLPLSQEAAGTQPTFGGNNSGTAPQMVLTANLLIRKRFLYDRVESVGVKGSDSFCLRIQGDHDYFFWTNHALIVALAIQKRLDALRSVKLLVSGASLDPREITALLRSFFSGELQLPQFVHSADNTKRRRSIIGNNMTMNGSPTNSSVAGSPTTASTVSNDPHRSSRACSVKENEYLETLTLRQALQQAYQGGYFPSTTMAVKRLVDSIQGESPEMIFLHSVREEMNVVREDWLEKIRTFCRPGKLLGNKFPILASVFANEDADGFDYADQDEDELNSVEELLSRVADDVLQELVVLPLYDALWESLHLESSVVGSQRAYDTNLNRFHSKSAADPISAIPASLETVNFDFALSHFGYLKQRRCPTAHLDMLVNIAKSIVLTIEAHERVHRRSSVPRTDDIPTLSQPGSPPADRAPTQSSAPSSPVARQPLMALPSVGTRSASAQQTVLSADDLLPVYIHLLSKSALPDVVLLREWISRLCDPKEISERTYYLTTFSCAVEFIIHGGQPSPDEMQDPLQSFSPPALDRSTSLRDNSSSP